VVTALLHGDCGASITESDYTAPSSPCSSRCSSDWSDATNDFIKLFTADAFPLLGSQPQMPTQQPTQQPTQPPQQRRRHKGRHPAPNTLWQHILQKYQHDLVVGMRVRLPGQPSQTGILCEREGAQRVRVAFFTSRGRPIYRWLNVEQVEVIPVPKGAPACEKSQH
jgi:hypothetical protein